MTFEELVNINCFSDDEGKKAEAAEILEKNYCCEINCTEIAPSVRFAHHARGCTIVAAKICENAVIFQNVTIGSNMKCNKNTQDWENIGNPIIGRNVVVADIVETGNHKELLAINGVYADIYNSQFAQSVA